MAPKKIPASVFSPEFRRGIQDLNEIISGKWKVPILITLYERPYKFKELSRELKISPRMLTRELQDLEMNKLIKRTVCDTKPTTVVYSVTEIGLTLQELLTDMGAWGISYRANVFRFLIAKL